MKGRSPHILSIISTIFLLQACGGSSGGSNERAGGTDLNGQTTELEGAWKKSCGPADSSDPDTHYDIVTATFTRGKFSSDIKNFEDSNCSIPLSFSPNPTASGTFVIGNTVTLTDGTQANELDTHIDTYDGAPFEIDTYGLYRIEGNIVYFEDDAGARDGSSPALRPQVLDYNRPFYRQ